MRAACVLVLALAVCAHERSVYAGEQLILLRDARARNDAFWVGGAAGLLVHKDGRVSTQDKGERRELGSLLDQPGEVTRVRYVDQGSDLLLVVEVDAVEVEWSLVARVSTSSRQLAWRAESAAAMRGSMCLAGDQIFLAGSGFAAALRYSNGEVLWRASLQDEGGAQQVESIEFLKGKVIVKGLSGTTLELNPDTGAIARKVPAKSSQPTKTGSGRADP